jgi:tRNA dimethylallyltransferase
MKKVLVITGPTASGKSELAMRLGLKHQGTLINADSQQVYRELNIGTAKPTSEQRLHPPHVLYDVCGYDESFSVKAYQTLARAAIDEVDRTNRLPIFVGGSGLYLKAALYDYDFIEDATPVSSMETLDPLEAHRRLNELDPKAAQAIHPNNVKRVLRALSLAQSTQTKSEREAKQAKNLVYDALIVVVDRHRAQLHQRIEARVEAMFKAGLKAEVERYFRDPRSWKYQSFQAIGYKEWRAYFEHGISESEVKERIVVATRQYAKRQYTWFRHQFKALWFNLDEQNENDLDRAIESWLSEEAR